MGPAEVREWKSRDKTGWPSGPWEDEPDKVHWVDPATDLDCLLHRGPMGVWCGYVAVTEGHPLFEVSPSGLPDLDVHGGITYANFCQEGDDPAVGICHVPFPGRPDRVWWIGFDCGHAYDRMPALEAREMQLVGLEKVSALFVEGTVYRDRAYAQAEVVRLARQVADRA